MVRVRVVRALVVRNLNVEVFSNKGPKTVKCSTLCDREYAFHGGTSNLCDYLVHIHSNEFKPKQQPNLDAFVIRSSSSLPTRFRPQQTSL